MNAQELNELLVTLKLNDREMTALYRVVIKLIDTAYQNGFKEGMKAQRDVINAVDTELGRIALEDKKSSR